MKIYGIIDQGTGLFFSIEHGDIVPAGGYEISAGDALAMSQTPYGHAAFRPNGAGGILLDQDAVAAFDLAEAQAQKRNELNSACRDAIVSGFTSSALGSPHTYASTFEDQLNLIGAKSAGVALPYPCRDANGVKADVPHTAVQLVQVFNDGMAIKVAALAKCRTLKNTVYDPLTDTIAKVQAVVW